MNNSLKEDLSTNSKSNKPFPWKGLLSLIVLITIFHWMCSKPSEVTGNNRTDQSSRDSAENKVNKAISDSSMAAFTEAFNKPDTADAASIEDIVSFGNFNYQVHGAGYNKTVGAGEYFRKADGVYLVVWLYFTNTSTVTRTLDNNDFKLVDRQGNEYTFSAEASASMELSGAKTIYSKECSPHVRKLAYLCFEVPEKDIYYLQVPDKTDDGLNITKSIKIPANL